MATLICKTKRMTTPHGKPRVYFCCHPQDHSTYFEQISEEILQQQNCAIWYLSAPEASRDKDFWEDLSQMQLFVLPVTRKLLTTDNPALKEDFSFAVRHHIPVLPLMQEEGLETLFNEKCGNLQFLNKYAQDATAIRYDEKLAGFLDSVLVSDELIKQIRNAFDGYIFLSYRKKDRRHAQELMRLIHKNDFCQNIAIWYDEFLTPGEDFNYSIRKAMVESDLFVMAVTPNLVCEANYVQEQEYPMAKAQEMYILPAEMVPTAHNLLYQRYAGFPGCVDAHNPYALTHALRTALNSIKLRKHDRSVQNDYYIGLAYLNGIDVEVDHERALKLITSAAEAGLTAAADKLVTMYGKGQGAPWNTDKMLYWQQRLIEYRRRDIQEKLTEENGVALLDDLRAMADVEEARQNYQAMASYLQEIIRLASILRSDDCCHAIIQHLAAANTCMGTLLQQMDQERRALEYLNRSEELLVDRLHRAGIVLRPGCSEEQSILLPAGDVDLQLMILLADLCTTLCNKADILLSMGQENGQSSLIVQADSLHLQVYRYLQSDAMRMGWPDRLDQLSIICSRLGDMEKRKGNKGTAKNWYLKALALDEDRLSRAGKENDPDAIETHALGCMSLVLLDPDDPNPHYLKIALGAFRKLAAIAPQFPIYRERVEELEPFWENVQKYQEIKRREDPYRDVFPAGPNTARYVESNIMRNFLSSEKKAQQDALRRLEEQRRRKALTGRAQEFRQRLLGVLNTVIRKKQQAQLEAERTEELFRMGQQKFQTEADRSEGLALLQQAADRGHPGAMCSIGICHRDGTGLPKDATKALALFEKAAEMGHGEAMYCLGQYHEKQDALSEALELYKKADARGFAPAKRAIDHVNWLIDLRNTREAAKQHYISAQGIFANTIKYNKAPAVEHLRKVVELSSSNYHQAAYYLGICYEKGIGTAKDYNKAHRYYEIANKSHTTETLYCIGRCRHYGIGVRRSLRRATQIYKNCAKYGHPGAYRKLLLLNPFLWLKVRKDYKNNAPYWYSSFTKGASIPQLDGMVK